MRQAGAPSEPSLGTNGGGRRGRIRRRRDRLPAQRTEIDDASGHQSPKRRGRERETREEKESLKLPPSRRRAASAERRGRDTRASLPVLPRRLGRLRLQLLTSHQRGCGFTSDEEIPSQCRLNVPHSEQRCHQPTSAGQELRQTTHTSCRAQERLAPQRYNTTRNRVLSKYCYCPIVSRPDRTHTAYPYHIQPYDTGDRYGRPL